jgi:diketogulonate reductase-like aldo/keto reductase
MTPQQVFFKYVQSLGITPLTGTTSSLHMAEDLATLDFSIDSEDVNAISRLMKI